MRILGVAGLVLCALSVGGCRGNAEMAELDPITLVRASLRAVASAQEAYWKEHHTYASSVEILEEFPGCKIQEGVSVRIVDASEHGFAAEATHPEFAGRSCVQWYGEPGAVQGVATSLEGKQGEESPGRVVCDAPFSESAGAA